MSENKFVSIDAILAANHVPEEVLNVPAWGGDVKIRALTKAKQIEIRKKAVHGLKMDETKMEGLLLVAGVVEPDLQEHHIPDLFSQASGPIDQVLAAIMRLSGMTEDDMKATEEDMKS